MGTDGSTVAGSGLAPAGSGTHQLAGRLRLVLARLARQLRRQDPTPLSIAQLSALATVVRCGPLGVGQLAEAELLPSPAATRLADKLEEAGLIERRVNPSDRRGVLLVATAAGAELVARRNRAGNAWLAGRLESLSAPDRAAVERAVSLLEALVADHADNAEHAGHAGKELPG